jgi:phosphoglycolate phosphatase
MHLLFDLDGTLVDPGRGIIGSVQYALDRLGAPVPPAGDLGWVIGPPLRISFAKLLGGPERAEEAITLYRQRYLGGAMFDAAVYEGLPQALDAVRTAGYRLLVATSKPHRYARPILEHFDLAGQFAAVYGPELDGTNDHKADLIANMIEREGILPEAAIMIGDRDFDVTAASRNGIRAIGVTWGYGSAKELTAAGAAALCHAPTLLAATLIGLQNGRPLSPLAREED